MGAVDMMECISKESVKTLHEVMIWTGRTGRNQLYVVSGFILRVAGILFRCTHGGGPVLLRLYLSLVGVGEK